MPRFGDTEHDPPSVPVLANTGFNQKPLREPSIKVKTSKPTQNFLFIPQESPSSSYSKGMLLSTRIRLHPGFHLPSQSLFPPGKG